MFSYLRVGKKQGLLKDELSLGSKLEGAADDENVWIVRCLLQHGGNRAGWVGHLHRWEVCILSETERSGSTRAMGKVGAGSPAVVAVTAVTARGELIASWRSCLATADKG